MPAQSKAQQHLMAAAEHGADFPMAEHVRESMTHEQMHDFAATKTKGLPARKTMSKRQRMMRDRSTRGSPPMSTKEMMMGYRCMGKA